MKIILPLWIGVFGAFGTLSDATIHYIARDYEERFWASRSNGSRCLVAQEGARFMRQFAMFARASRLDELGEISCLANFRQAPALMPQNRTIAYD